MRNNLAICLLVMALLLMAGLATGSAVAVLLFPGMEGDAEEALWAQTLLSVVAFGMPALVFAWWRTRGEVVTPCEGEDGGRVSVARFLRLDARPEAVTVVMGVVAMLLMQPLSTYTAYVNEQWALPECLRGMEEWMRGMEDTATEETLRLLDFKGGQSLWLVLLGVAVVPAVTEELLFRGAIQPLLTSRVGAHAGVWLTAAIFSAFHFQFFGFLPRMLLGALLGYLFVYSGSMWVNMVAHLVNNAAVVVYVYVAIVFGGEDVTAAMRETDGWTGTDETGAMMAVVMGAAVAVILVVMRKRRMDKERIANPSDLPVRQAGQKE